LGILQEKNKLGATEADKLAIVLASYNLGPTSIINVANEISEDITNISWDEISERLETIKGQELNLTDNGSYTRGQQAIDYVNRVKDYYRLLSAHSCIAPIDRLTFSLGN
jgi:membrane-bound lytic murein transglycosylase F